MNKHDADPAHFKYWRVLAIPWWEDDTYWCLGFAPSPGHKAAFDGRVGSGSTREILTIATAIDKADDVRFTRCAVRRIDSHHVELWSPRAGDLFRAVVSLNEARALAGEIRSAVAAENRCASGCSRPTSPITKRSSKP